MLTEITRYVNVVGGFSKTLNITLTWAHKRRHSLFGRLGKFWTLFGPCIQTSPKTKRIDFPFEASFSDKSARFPPRRSTSERSPACTPWSSDAFKSHQVPCQSPKIRISLQNSVDDSSRPHCREKKCDGCWHRFTRTTAFACAATQYSSASPRHYIHEKLSRLLGCIGLH